MDIKAGTERYSRQTMLKEVGISGQQKLRDSSVLIVGCGGLGLPVAQYLNATGIGNLGLVDGDRVELSNLHRQTLYTFDHLKMSKVKVLSAFLSRQNPDTAIHEFPVFLGLENAEQIISAYDIVVDASDNFPTRYLLNDFCVKLDKSLVAASIERFEIQMGVFNAPLNDGSRSANLRDLFPETPPPGVIPNCAEAGVLGMVPGLAGTMQAHEVIKLILDFGKILFNRWMILETLMQQSRIITYLPDPKNLLYRDADAFIKSQSYETPCVIPDDIRSIDVSELKRWQTNGKEFQLIDVREKKEYEIVNLGGELIPLSQLSTRYAQVAKQKAVLVYCQSGARSQKAIELLSKLGEYDLYNLEGGIKAWLNQEEKAG